MLLKCQVFSPKCSQNLDQSKLYGFFFYKSESSQVQIPFAPIPFALRVILTCKNRPPQQGFECKKAKKHNRESADVIKLSGARDIHAHAIRVLLYYGKSSI